MALTLDRADVLHFVRHHWVILLSTAFVARYLHRRYRHPLRAVPGPFLASVTSLWLVKYMFRHDQHRDYVELHRKYGPVVRISPNRVIISTPKHINEYFSWDKSRWWTAFAGHPTVSDHGGFLSAEEARGEKAKIMGGYSMSHIVKSESKMDSHIRELMSQLGKRTGTIFDLAPWTQWIAFDIVMDVTFSKPMGFVAEARDVGGLIEALHNTFTVASIAGLFPAIPRLLNHPLWYPAFSPKASDTTGIGAAFGLAYRTTRARLQEEPSLQSQHHDILQWLIDHKDRDGNLLSPTRLEQEAKAPIFAGSDTTSGNLRAMILYVYSHPRVHGRLLAEIAAAEADGRLSFPTARFDEIARHVPYLAAVRKEALRMMPVAGGPFFRAVPHRGATVEGHSLPGGTEVGITHWAIARDPAFWGPDVDVFRPERWEEDADEERKRLRDLGDVFFSRAGRLCTGRNVATMEIYKVFVALMRRFEVQIVRPDRPWKERGGLAVLHWDFDVVLTERVRDGGL